MDTKKKIDDAAKKDAVIEAALNAVDFALIAAVMAEEAAKKRKK